MNVYGGKYFQVPDLVKVAGLDISVWNKSWVVFCEPSMAKFGHVTRYLGQFTYRVAITNQCITDINEHAVTFMHKDYTGGAWQKPITLDGVEFLRRFCLHILPLRIVKIRRYVIYSSRARILKLRANPKIVISIKPWKPHRSPDGFYVLNAACQS